ncbi:MAG: acyltransferase [Candidatus Dormiibacterota bacterium]
MQRLDRWPALDGLRALAVCAVILTHTWVSQFPGGWIGVDVFFVLSGFLITGVLLREHGETGTISLLGFYRRRVVRLLPALLVMLLIVVIAAYVFRPGLAAATLRTAIFTVVYSANWLAASHQPLGLLSHMWSLSVEEQFYLVWPVLLVVMLRWRGARIALIVTILCVVAVVIHRTLLAQLVDLHDPQLFWRTDTRVDSILVGCALCLASSLGWKGSERLWRIAAIVGAAYMGALLPTAYNTGGWNYTIGYTLLALAAAGVVGAAAVRPWQPLVRVLSWSPLVRLGKISYAVYLWHLPIAILLPMGQGPVLALVTFVLSVLIAGVSWHVVERPAQRWRSASKVIRPVAA